MKNPSFHRRRGFTLVELLVVIAIIAVLASAGFAAGNAAMNRARTVSAQAMASGIESAVNNFYSDYGYMPVESTGTEDIDPIRTDEERLLVVLLGMDEPTQPALNRKGIRFLDVKEGKRVGTRGKDGLVYSANGNSVIGLFDPWGNPFHVALDTSYDERLEISRGGRPPERLNGRKVAVFSAGSDSDLGTTKDVKTW